MDISHTLNFIYWAGPPNFDNGPSRTVSSHTGLGGRAVLRFRISEEGWALGNSYGLHGCVQQYSGMLAIRFVDLF